MQRTSIAATLFFALLLAGCASPGSPAPPSLNLPEPVKDLQAERWGSTVRLSWTAPERTTDGLLLTGASSKHAFSAKGRSHSGALAAEVCRMEAHTCIALTRLTVRPQEKATYIDTLPSSLQSGPPTLVEYRVRILNAAGRSAGDSNPALAASGDVPAPITGFAIRPVREGAELHWTPITTGPAFDQIDIVRQPVTVAAVSDQDKKEKTPKSVLLRVQATPDPGGTVDTSIRRDVEYTYTAARVRHLSLNGHTLDAHGAPASVNSGALTNDFPPNAPTGLEAVASPATGPRKAAIDLSWEPNQETDLAGYFVYRADSTQPDVWSRITAQRIPSASYHDEAVTIGHTYLYRVTAVSLGGKEGKPSASARETLPGVE